MGPGLEDKEMPDYFTGTISFPVSFTDDEVKKALEDEKVKFEDGKPVESTGEPEVYVEEGIFTLANMQARYGQFEDLENLLRQKGIPFDRQSGQAYEFYPELVIFRPGENGAPALSLYFPLVGSSDKPGIIAQDIKDLIPKGIEAIQAYLDEHFPAYPPLSEYVEVA
jgi:hypothetical protein